MADELHKLMAVAGAQASGACLYCVGLEGVKTVCMKWMGPFEQHDLLEQVEERALRQANVLGGIHNFLFELLDAEGKQIATEFFRVSAENYGSNGSILSEPANEGGYLAQTMRHNEAIMRNSIQGTRDLLKAQQAMVERSDRRADKLETKFMESIELIAAAVTGQQQHQIELVKAEGTAAVKKKVGEQLAGLIPEVIGSLVSGKTGQAAHGAAIAAKGLFSSLTEEQMRAILGALEPGQQMALMGLMKRLAQEAEGTPKVNGDARQAH